jgi:hypothetical protein
MRSMFVLLIGDIEDDVDKNKEFIKPIPIIGI